MFTIPPDWQEAIAEYIESQTGEQGRTRLLASDFPGGQCVHVRLDDGSYCFFHYAFAVSRWVGQRRQFLVCTEHCGYFVFDGVDDIKVLRRHADRHL